MRSGRATRQRRWRSRRPGRAPAPNPGFPLPTPAPLPHRSPPRAFLSASACFFLARFSSSRRSFCRPACSRRLSSTARSATCGELVGSWRLEGNSRRAARKAAGRSSGPTVAVAPAAARDCAPSHAGPRAHAPAASARPRPAARARRGCRRPPPWRLDPGGRPAGGGWGGVEAGAERVLSEASEAPLGPDPGGRPAGRGAEE